jgi:uncharacterized protein
VKKPCCRALACLCLAGGLIFADHLAVAQEGDTPAPPPGTGSITAPAAAPAQGTGRRGRGNQAPLPDENAGLVNLAPVATPTTSYVSGDQTILAINDGANPRRSREHYGNWPRGGTQWVELTWSKPISTNKADVYWYADGAGIHLPKASRLQYFNGTEYVEVPNAEGLGVKGDVWNVTKFDEITTNKIRLEIDAEGGPQVSTGITEFRVFDSGKSPKFPPRVKAGIDRVAVLGAKTYLNGELRQLGAAADDSKVTWSKESGPGDVNFDDAHSVLTRAAFSKVGEYALKLTAGEDDMTSSDTLKVRVEPAATAAHLEPVYTTKYKISSQLWRGRDKALIVNWIPHCYTMVDDPNLREGGISNLVEAGKKLRGEPAKYHVGYPFSNAWIYNTLESMCLAQMLDPEGDAEIAKAQETMRAKIDDWIPIILAAQEPDGYLQSRFTLGTARDGGNAPPHWDPQRGRGEHEGYVAGYFLEAAISHYNMTGGKDRRLYDAAKKLADCWYDNLGPAPKKAWYDGHQEMEQALVRFARMVDHVDGKGKGDKYTELAKFLIESRRGGSTYDQSHVPAVQQYEAVGHAVRAAYFYSAMADIAMMTHDLDYQSAANSIWDNIVNKKYYITGGIGSGETSEGFGPNYSLRNGAYCESCSGTAELFFQYKMDLTYQDAKFADLLEETLYNALMGDIDMDGNNFCYTNALDAPGNPDPRYPSQSDDSPRAVDYRKYHAQLNGYRYPWHTCPCCVGNIPRTMLMLPTWLYATNPDGIYVNLFAGSTVNVENVAGTNVEMVQETNYPWDGKISITVKPQQAKNFAVHIRVPKRSVSEIYSSTPDSDGMTSISVNGAKLEPKVENGYIVIKRDWKAGDKIDYEVPMKPQRVKAIEQVAADRGLVAVKYGPLVYNFEAADNPQMEGRALPTLKSDAPLTTEWRPELLQGVVVVKTQAVDGSPLIAIPNYARNNRSGHSAVWIKDEAGSGN